MRRCLVFVLAVFASFVHGPSDVDRVSVSVMEGDSVTLHTNTINPKDRIVWYFHGIRIALINRGQSEILTDVECKNVTERFRDRLKLDNHKGDLTITNITNTHSGEYHQSMNIKSDTYFTVSVQGVSAAERDQMRRKMVNEGESVTLDPGEVKTNDVMLWYYNDTLLAEITDQRQICTVVLCNNKTKRFRDRLKLDHQTGSLTITNTRTEDSGVYKLLINNSRFSITKIFSVSVTGSGLFGVVAGAAVSVLLLAAAAGFGVMFCLHRSSKKGKSALGMGSEQTPGHQDIYAIDIHRENL